MSRPTPRVLPHTVSLLSTRQKASTFNQALSLDTSSVTTMQGMFYVRSTRVLYPTFQWKLCMHAACATATPRSPVILFTPCLASYALLPTRQSASSFNQPLSLDTSSVTTMYDMFWVRSAACPAP